MESSKNTVLMPIDRFRINRFHAAYILHTNELAPIGAVRWEKLCTNGSAMACVCCIGYGFYLIAEIDK